MTTLAERLQEARIEAGYESATDAAKAFGWNENTYRSNENGHRPPGRKTCIKYARAYRVSIDWLLTGRGQKKMIPGTTQSGIALRQIPIVRWSDISASQPIRALVQSADPRGFVVVSGNEQLSQDAFALEVQDDSMVDPQGSRASIFAGDTVIIDPDREAHPGSIVLAKDGNRGMVRKLRVVTEADGGGSERVALVPLNPDYPTKEVAGNKVLGVMVAFYRRTVSG